MTSLRPEKLLGGWGNCPRQSCHLESVERWNDVSTFAAAHDSMIARGLGRAYGDAALNEGGAVLDVCRLNRFLAFDAESGLLECEAGVSFAEIIDVFLPRGWFLPTTPGTKFVTVGGAIAADVHGKNHHLDGSFGNFVEQIHLQLADGSRVICSREHDPDLFWATIGGMGLTGVILSATFRLVRVTTAYCDVEYRRTTNLDATLDVFQATHHQYQYSVAWIDCVATGRSMGRSVAMLGNNAGIDSLPASLKNKPLTLPVRRKKSIPFHFPSWTLNPWSVKAFNTLYYAKNGNGRKLVDFDSYYYPLDGVSNWNRIYGRAGFVQYQALFPHETARDGLTALLQKISHSKQASFLAVLKGCGAATPGMLSYLFPGYTLALDFPYRGKSTRDLFDALDRIVLEHQGRIYLAKDALASADTFARMYPRLTEFQQIKARVDPHNRFTSSQARRLGIVQSTRLHEVVHERPCPVA